MRKFTRQESPHFLINNWAQWGERYRINKTANPNFPFQWPTHQGQRINILLEPLLKEQTDQHCSFCDNFPIRSREDSIDHFKPKSRPEFYELICNWDNLFYSCANCQGYKLEQYDEHLLRPDDDNYSFDSYFVYSFRTHVIDPNPVLSGPELNKAQTTIRIFGLNDPGNIAARRISLERYDLKRNNREDIELNDFAYRFIFQ